MRELFLLTGSMRAGKTSFCKILFQTLKTKSPFPFAIVEESLRDPQGIPLTIVLRDLGEGDEVPLAARQRPRSDISKPYPPFSFSQEAFLWAESRVREAVRKGCGPVILDEMGPLEANEGGGFFGIASWLVRNGDYPLLVTVRPSLERVFYERLQAMSGIFPAKRFDIGKAPLGAMLDTLRVDMFRHCQDGKQDL
jgi:nucleoside-triphosphatase THEP1